MEMRRKEYLSDILSKIRWLSSSSEMATGIKGVYFYLKM